MERPGWLKLSLLGGVASIAIGAGAWPRAPEQLEKPLAVDIIPNLLPVINAPPVIDAEEEEIRAKQISGYQEIAPPLGTWLNGLAELGFYRQNRGDLDHDIATCRAAPQDCNPRFKAWVDLIDTLKPINDDMTKVAVTDSWVHSVIAPDHDKAVNAQTIPAEAWMQRPQETLRKGTGVCVDFATLEYETLRQAGISTARLRLVSGSLRGGNKYGHMVMVVDVGGTNWMLSSYSDLTMPQAWHDQGADGRLKDFAQNAILRTDYEFMDKQRFTLTESDNDSGGWLYPDQIAALPRLPESEVSPLWLMQNLPPAQKAQLDSVIREILSIGGNPPSPATTARPLQTTTAPSP